MFCYNYEHNTTKFITGVAIKNASEDDLIRYANTQFKEHLWFSIYKFMSYEHLFITSSVITVEKWVLYKKFPNTLAVGEYMPMPFVYKIGTSYDDWYFKSS